MFLESSFRRHQLRQLNLFRMIHAGDLACIENTRMDRKTFGILCHQLRTIGGLKGTKNIDVEEMVAIFLHIISYDIKNRIVRQQFARSGETVSRQFNVVLNALLRLHGLLLKKPEPILDGSTDERWQWFKNCLYMYILLFIIIYYC
uniref:DUF8040 domain-containing protein n=1 Tax=Cannabis sativa TaxID=3483 RepID=A0A803QYQ2_CANSA